MSPSGREPEVPGVLGLVVYGHEGDYKVACVDCNAMTGGAGWRVYSKKCGGCDSVNIVRLPPPPPLRTFTLRICPVCGIIAVDEDELDKGRRGHPFKYCEGPWFAGFPTDRSHKITQTQCVVVKEEVPMSPLATLTGDKNNCHVHPDRQAVVLLEDTREPLCAECYREHMESMVQVGDEQHGA